METSWLARSFNIPAHPPASGVAAYKENATKVKLDMFWHIWGQGGGLFSPASVGHRKQRWSWGDSSHLGLPSGFHSNYAENNLNTKCADGGKAQKSGQKSLGAKLAKNDWRPKIKGKSKNEVTLTSLCSHLQRSLSQKYLCLLLQQNLHHDDDNDDDDDE